MIAELQSLADAVGREAPEDTLALIDHILGRYHETHRAELQWLIPLAQKSRTCTAITRPHHLA
ncbi:MAG: hypothetical protein R3D56_04145 [Paracoccaceae bacterium]